MSFFFLNAALLAGSAAVVVPVVIHLLQRQKARVDVLPTLRFLEAGLAANRRRMRVKHLLVLLLRVAAILLIVATLSRPAFVGAALFREGSSPVAAVVVIDNSMSMAYKEAGRSSLERAVRLACDAVKSLPAGSRAALVATGAGPSGESLDAEFTFNRDALCDRIRRLELAAYGGDVPSALARAYQAFSSEENGRKPELGREVYVLSDLSACAWKGPGPGRDAPEAAVIVLDISSERDENFSLAGLESEWRSGAAPFVRLSARIRSGELAAARLLEVYVDGAKRAEKVIEVPIASTFSESIDIPLLETPSSFIQGWAALADADPITADNSRYFTVGRAREVRCLVAAAPEAALYIANALEPRALEGATGVTVRTVDPKDLSAADIQALDVVVLSGEVGAPAEVWPAIERFSASGGGLVAFLPEGQAAGSYLPFLAKYFAVTVGAEVRAAAGQAARLKVLSFDHPVLAAFSGGRNGNLAAARFSQWRRLVRLESGDVQPVELARFADRQPAILAAPVGRGRCLVAAFTPTRGSGDLVLQAAFVPLVGEMTRYAAGARGAAEAARVNFVVGDTVTIAVAKTSEASTVSVLTPFGDRPLELGIAPGADRAVFRPFSPGNHIAIVPGENSPQRAAFTANLDAREFEPARVSAADIEKSLPGCAIVKDISEQAAREARGGTRGAREIYDMFLVLAVAVLAVEAFVANRFYREPSGQGR